MANNGTENDVTNFLEAAVKFDSAIINRTGMKKFRIKIYGQFKVSPKYLWCVV